VKKSTRQGNKRLIEMSTSATDAPKDPRIIDGNAIAAKVRAEVAESVQKLKESGHRAPGIAVLLVGDRTDSSTYVRMKKQACEQVGFVFQLIQLPSTTSEEEIIQHGALSGPERRRKKKMGCFLVLPSPASFREMLPVLTSHINMICHVFVF
jgi:5,10-methylene-tetrahydrofolate dehydrogenase/methenyl tetrahydrofolate cyclohydrolase